MIPPPVAGLSIMIDRVVSCGLRPVHCMSDSISRRELLRNAALAAAGFSLAACQRPQAEASSSARQSASPGSPDEVRLNGWTSTVRREGLTRRDVALGRSATRVGELAIGT